MTSEKVMLTVVTLLCVVVMGGCDSTPDDLFTREHRTATPLISPYQTPRVWAVAPFANESGSQHADRILIADQVAMQLQQASNINVVSTNRVLNAMESLRMPVVASRDDARKLMQLLGVDGLVVGSITSYNPYDPPKLGLAIELYVDEIVEVVERPDLRQLIRTPSEQGVEVAQPAMQQPVTRLAGYFDAADPEVREALKVYANRRGSVDVRGEAWHPYRLSMARYTEFVGYIMSYRLLRAESQRMVQTHLSAPLP